MYIFEYSIIDKQFFKYLHHMNLKVHAQEIKLVLKSILSLWL
jgi:hypothetical protein